MEGTVSVRSCVTEQPGDNTLFPKGPLLVYDFQLQYCVLSRPRELGEVCSNGPILLASQQLLRVVRGQPGFVFLAA